MNIVNIKHPKKISDKAKGEFKMISNSDTTTKKSDNIHPAKIISITDNKYSLSYLKNVQEIFFSNAHGVFALNEFQKELPIDHVMVLKNFCS